MKQKFLSKYCHLEPAPKLRGVKGMKQILLSSIILFCITTGYAQGIWTQKADFGGTARYLATGFSLGSQGYIGLGYNDNFPVDFWQYDAVAGTWTQKANFPSLGRAGAVGFNIGSKGFIIAGISSGYPINDLWEYDAANNSWTQKATFPGEGRSYPTGFSIGNKGYFGTGFSGTGQFLKDFGSMIHQPTRGRRKPILEAPLVPWPRVLVLVIRGI